MFRSVLPFLLIACSGAPDARLTANLYTDTCARSGKAWLGVEAFDVTLEVARGGVPDRALPGLVGQCTVDHPVFASESPFSSEGDDIPDLEGTPRWSSDQVTGSLAEEGVGLWRNDRTPPAGCSELDATAPDGIRLDDAGVFDGLTTPVPGEAGLVSIDGKREDEATKPVVHGNAMGLSWTTTGWDESFVQLRVLSRGRVQQTLTCNTTGRQEFDVAATHWDQLDAAGTDQAQIFVGFQITSTEKVPGFGEAEAVTRMVAMLGDNET